MIQSRLSRSKRVKDALRNRKPLFAGWTSLGNPQITEAFGGAGFDFVGIDIEHGTISFEQAQRIVAAAQSTGSVCLPRIASHSMEAIKRYLDSGADGVIVPMVDTPAQVAQLVEWSKYPPAGKRSFGVNRAQDYGFGFDEYTRDWNSSSSLVIQIESITGVENAERMMTNPEVDACMIGPYDLSGSLGIPGEIDHPKVQEAARHVIEVCRKLKKGCGTQIVDPDAASIQEKWDQGYTFTVLSSDIFLLWKWGEKMRGLIEGFRSSCRLT